MQGYGGK
jgi:hypothetical protein